MKVKVVSNLFRRLNNQLSQRDLNQIMRLVDERIAEMPMYQEHENLINTSMPITDISRLSEKLTVIRALHAPKFIVTGWTPTNILRRIINIPISLFGHKQRLFNNMTIELLDDILLEISRLQQHIDHQDREIGKMRSTIYNPSIQDPPAQV